MGAALFFTSQSKLAYTWDTDAVAYLTACGIPNDGTIYYSGTPQQRTGLQIWTYINDFCLSLKAANYWNIPKPIYPIIGGTAATHKYNLKDPRDLDAAFRLTFYGGLTHGATGITPNGINGYADTHYTPSISSLLNSSHLCYMSRSADTLDGALLGCNDSVVNRHFLGKGNTWAALNSTSHGNYNPASYLGLHLINRINSTETKQYYNGNPIITSTISSSARPSGSIYLFCRHAGELANNFVTNECDFVSIGDGFATDADILAYRNIIQNLQTALGR